MIALKREIAVPAPDPHSRVQPFSKRLNRSIEKRSKTPALGTRFARDRDLRAVDFNYVQRIRLSALRADVLVPEERSALIKHW
jgi:hypothetical protein